MCLALAGQEAGCADPCNEGAASPCCPPSCCRAWLCHHSEINDCLQKSPYHCFTQQFFLWSCSFCLWENARGWCWVSLLPLFAVGHNISQFYFFRVCHKFSPVSMDSHHPACPWGPAAALADKHTPPCNEVAAQRESVQVVCQRHAEGYVQSKGLGVGLPILRAASSLLDVLFSWQK